MKHYIVLFALLTLFSCHKESHSVVVLEKNYTPSSNGMGLSSKGSLVTTYISEDFNIFYQKSDGEIGSKSISKSEYFKTKVGDTITINTLEI